MQVRPLVSFPPPQETVQLDQALHGVHAPSTNIEVMNLKPEATQNDTLLIKKFWSIHF